jgi:hypothetical protein
MPYDFKPRFPVDHVLSLVRLVRKGETGSGQVFVLVGAISGEIGALMGEGPIFSLSAPELDSIETALSQLEELESSVADDANFDPTPWIPIVLWVIRWLLERRG